MEDMYTEDPRLQTISETDEKFYTRAMRFTSTPKYELGMNILTIINICTVFFNTCRTSTTERQVHIWIVLELVINYLMLLETIGDILTTGLIKAFRYHFRIYPESLCQLLNIPATIIFISGNGNF